MKDNRRTVLKAVVMGSGTVTMSQLPAQWSKPIVNSIFLPAHAITTTSESDTASEDTPVPETTPVPECADCSLDQVSIENTQAVPPSGPLGTKFELQCVYRLEGTGSSVWVSFYVENSAMNFSRSYTQCVHVSGPIAGTKVDFDSSSFPGAGKYEVTAEIFCESTQLLATDQTTFVITQ